MDILTTSLTLLLVMDPFGNLPIYMSVLNRVPEARRRQVLIREQLIALVVLLAFLFGGAPVIHLIGLHTSTIGIAGGLILFLIALRMIQPPPGGEPVDEVDAEPLVVPLAIPLVAGPSSLATLILFNARFPEQLGALFLATLIAWGLSAAILFASPLFVWLLKPRGLVAMERLMGMVLVAVAVQMLLDGVSMYFGIGPAASAG